MTTETRDPTTLGAFHTDCGGGELLLYTDAGGAPVPSRKEGCFHAYCDGCGAVGPVSCDQALRMRPGMPLPSARPSLTATQVKQEVLAGEEAAKQDEANGGKKPRFYVAAPGSPLGRSLQAQSAGLASARARRARQAGGAR